MSDNLRLSQLLCSRLCHDLVGAAGAVNAGLEILSEIGGLDDSAMDLAVKSGHELTRRLAFYRVAFGAGGAGTDGAELKVLKKLTTDFFASGHIEVDWPLDDGELTHIDALLGKLTLNLILIASECLPRGGTISVRIAAVNDEVGIAISGDGPDAGLREDLAQGLSEGQTTGGMDSRSIHSLLTQLLVLEIGCELEIAADDDSVRFAALTSP